MDSSASVAALFPRQEDRKGKELERANTERRWHRDSALPQITHSTSVKHDPESRYQRLISAKITDTQEGVWFDYN